MLIVISIILTAFFDSLSFTGYFFYGTGVMAAASIALLNEMSALRIFALICIGAGVGDIINYFTGRFLSHSQRVKDVLAKAEHSNVIKKIMYHNDDTLIRKIVIAVVLRVFAITRPVNAIFLGTISRQTWQDLLALLIAVMLWTAVWLAVFRVIVSAVS